MEKGWGTKNGEEVSGNEDSSGLWGQASVPLGIPGRKGVSLMTTYTTLSSGFFCLFLFLFLSHSTSKALKCPTAEKHI